MKLLYTVFRNQPVKNCNYFITQCHLLHRLQFTLDRTWASKVTMDTSALSTNGVVPDVMDKIPSKTLNIAFEAGPVDMGNVFKLAETAAFPNITYEADPDKFYTLVHVDPDAPTRSFAFLRSVLHGLVVNIPGGDVSKGENRVEYRGAGAPPLTGLHRYVFLLYEQPDKLEFDEPKVAADTRSGRMRFDPRRFAEKYKLSGPIAANFYQARYTRE